MLFGPSTRRHFPLTTPDTSSDERMIVVSHALFAMTHATHSQIDTSALYDSKTEMMFEGSDTFISFIEMIDALFSRPLRISE